MTQYLLGTSYVPSTGLKKAGMVVNSTIPSLDRLTVHCGEGKQITKETVVTQGGGAKHRELGE